MIGLSTKAVNPDDFTAKTFKILTYTPALTQPQQRLRTAMEGRGLQADRAKIHLLFCSTGSRTGAQRAPVYESRT